MDWRIGNRVLYDCRTAYFGVGNQVLFSAEATGVTHDKIHPKISVMAQCLWTVYLVLTVAEIVLLLIGGMDLFDAACHAFLRRLPEGILPSRPVWLTGILLL